MLILSSDSASYVIEPRPPTFAKHPMESFFQNLLLFSLILLQLSFIVVGVVTSFTFVKWVIQQGQDSFDNFSNNHERVVGTWQVIVSIVTGVRYIDSNYGACYMDR